MQTPQHKKYKIQPAEMALLSIDTIEFYLDFDDMRFIWGYSQQLLKSVCEATPHLAPLFAEKLSAMAAAIKSRDDCEFLRPGSGAYFMDKHWLALLAEIAAKVAAKSVQTTAPVAATVEAPVFRRAAAADKAGFVLPTADDVLGKGAEAMAQLSAQKLTDLYLPSLNIGQFMVPTMLARSGLFAPDGARGARHQAFTTAAPRILSHLSGVRAGQTTIHFVGEELWTSDEEVWTSLLAEAVTTPLGVDVSMRMLDLLNMMPGRGVDGTSPRQRVRSAGTRLMGATLKITTSDPATIATVKACLPNNTAVRDAEKKGFLELNVKLLEQFASSTDVITFRIGRELRALFGDKLHTWYDREAYYSLPAKGLSRRLFMLYNSHYECMPLTQAELTEFLGIKAKTARNVRIELEAAHTELSKRGMDLGHTYRVPTKEERLGCSTPCFVVKRAKRISKVVAAAAQPAVGQVAAAPDVEDEETPPPVLEVIDFANDYADAYEY